MGTICCWIACALAAGQPVPADSIEWSLAPRLNRGQELYYRGSFSEESLANRVQSIRNYRVETRVFVLEADTRTAEVVFFTLLKMRDGPQLPSPASPAQTSARTETARIDGQGKITWTPGTTCNVPLEGPPTMEHGMFVEVPRGRISLERTWILQGKDRPEQVWRPLGTEMVNNTSCLKLVGLQQSDDWDRPRADRTAWRRQDLVWIAPRTGYALRVERTLEQRQPARQEISQKSVLRYELEQPVQYPGQLFEDRRREILFARSVDETLASILPRAGQLGPRSFEALLVRIKSHLERQPATPYREAILTLQRRAEAGKRGESPPEHVVNRIEVPNSTIVQGQPAPDFVVTDFTGKETFRLGRWLGRPVLLVFHNPTGATALDVLRFAQRMHDEYGPRVMVLGLAMSEDGDPVLKQRTDLGLKFPILRGLGLRVSFGVETTPKLVVLDSAGVVRSSYVGWGPEAPVSVREDLRRCLQADLKRPEPGAPGERLAIPGR